MNVDRYIEDIDNMIEDFNHHYKQSKMKSRVIAKIDVETGDILPIDEIRCPHCNKFTGYKKIMYMVIDNDILCPHCGKIIIKAIKISC